MSKLSRKEDFVRKPNKENGRVSGRSCRGRRRNRGWEGAEVPGCGRIWGGERPDTVGQSVFRWGKAFPQREGNRACVCF